VGSTLRVTPAATLYFSVSFAELHRPMRRHLMKSKIHRATITSADLHYEGSLTLDEDLLDAADLVSFDEVQIVNVNNGARFSTYVIPGPRGSGVVQLNGAAARLGIPGDLVILMSYAEFDEKEVAQFRPRVVFVDEQNRVVRPPLRAES
jgi:aspartate 1-decarboxylase